MLGCHYVDLDGELFILVLAVIPISPACQALREGGAGKGKSCSRRKVAVKPICAGWQANPRIDPEIYLVLPVVASAIVEPLDPLSLADFYPEQTHRRSLIRYNGSEIQKLDASRSLVNE